MKETKKEIYLLHARIDSKAPWKLQIVASGRREFGDQNRFSFKQPKQLEKQKNRVWRVQTRVHVDGTRNQTHTNTDWYETNQLCERRLVTK